MNKFYIENKEEMETLKRALSVLEAQDKSKLTDLILGNSMRSFYARRIDILQTLHDRCIQFGH